MIQRIEGSKWTFVTTTWQFSIYHSHSSSIVGSLLFVLRMCLGGLVFSSDRAPHRTTSTRCTPIVCMTSFHFQVPFISSSCCTSLLLNSFWWMLWKDVSISHVDVLWFAAVRFLFATCDDSSLSNLWSDIHTVGVRLTEVALTRCSVQIVVLKHWSCYEWFNRPKIRGTKNSPLHI